MNTTFYLTKAVRLTVLLSLPIITGVAFVFYMQQRSVSFTQEHLPYLQLPSYAKNKTTTAHLSLHQLIAGNAAVDFNRAVDGPLSSVTQLLQAAYDGKNSELGQFRKREDEISRILIKEAIVSAENLSVLVNQRRKDGQLAGNSTAEEAFTQAFNDLHTRLDKLSVHFKTLAADQEQTIQRLLWLGSSIFTLILAGVVFLFYRLHRNSEQVLAANKARLEAETKRVAMMSQFIEAISAGNFEIELTNDNENDGLIDTLRNMRNTLRQNAEDDRKRNWSTTGLAQIGEILRADLSSSAELYDAIIKFIVKYTKSNQGGLFILNEEDETDASFLELVACYAFERKKYLKKKVAIGDGLVGQCFLEGDLIYLTDVPKEYITITSGLGGANPSSVLVVPMKVNDQVYGVVELASFNTFKDHEIELILKFAESVAATISNVRINEKTKILLERTQQQAEEMKSQEEEIRQNMEELEATQEEMRRKQVALEQELDESQRKAVKLQQQEESIKQSQSTLQAIVDTIPRAIFWKDKDLRFMGCNRIFANIAGFSNPAELTGKTDFDMSWSAQADAYRRDDLEVMRSRKGKLDIEEVNINSDGEESWVRTSKVPVIDPNGTVIAILGMFEDITQWKRKEADIAQKLRERDEALQEIKALKDLIEVQNRKQ